MHWSAVEVAGIRDGTVTEIHRRWRRPQVVTGRRYRTPAGMIEVTGVAVVDESALDDGAARRSGHPDRASLVAALARAPDPTAPVHRVRFRPVDAPDPRDVLASDGALDADGVAAVGRRLARLDRASPAGPWTDQVLELIAAHPGVRAADLAGWVGMDPAAFKRRVRRLKEAGLTVSLEVGYRLSPRGEAYRRAVAPPPG